MGSTPDEWESEVPRTGAVPLGIDGAVPLGVKGAVPLGVDGTEERPVELDVLTGDPEV